MIPIQKPEPQPAQPDSESEPGLQVAQKSVPPIETLLKAPVPLVLTGPTIAEVSAYLADDLIRRLDLDLETTEAALFLPHPEDGILNSLAEALCATFAGLTKELLDTVAPRQWGLMARGLMRHATQPGIRRVIIVDQFEDVFLAPQGEREEFSRILTQLARDPNLTVVIGITLGSLRRCQKLPGLRQALREGAQLSIEAPAWNSPQLSRSSRAAHRMRNANDWLYTRIADFSDVISDMAVGRMLGLTGAVSLVIGIAVAGFALWGQTETPTTPAETAEPAPEIVKIAVDEPKTSEPVGQQLPAPPVVESSSLPDPNAEIVFNEGPVEVLMSDDAERVLPPTNLTPVSDESAIPPLEHKQKQPKTNEDGAPAGEDANESSESPADASSGRGAPAPEKDTNPRNNVDAVKHPRPAQH